MEVFDEYMVKRSLLKLQAQNDARRILKTMYYGKKCLKDRKSTSRCLSFIFGLVYAFIFEYCYKLFTVTFAARLGYLYKNAGAIILHTNCFLSRPHDKSYRLTSSYYFGKSFEF